MKIKVTKERGGKAEVEPQPPAEQVRIVVETPKEVHSVYSTSGKRIIVLVASFTSFISPLATNIYLPALDDLSSALHVTDTQINLSITTYLILQAIAPTIVAGFSDNVGRRPAYIICFVIYIGANIGLALQTNYAVLMALRALQSGGSSGTISLCNGVIADVATSAERGSYIAIGSLQTILGPTVAPVAGGLLAKYLRWRAIFWFLTIFAAPLFVFVLLFLPETSHMVVGNGSYKPSHLLNKSLTAAWLHRKWAAQGRAVDPDGQAKLHANYKFRMPSPLPSIAIVFTKGAGLLLLFNGLLLGILYLILSSIPSMFSDSYGFDSLKLSLIYLPYGCGAVASAFTTGKLANANYRRHARRLGFPLEKAKQLDLSQFPIEQARLEIALPLLYLGSALLVAYGWIMHAGNLSLAAPITLLFFLGWCIICIYQVSAVLITDMYPDKPATATASNNLVRCLFAAASAAITVPMLERLGRGWTFTLAALIFASSSSIIFVLMIKGPTWRREIKANKSAEATTRAKAKQAGETALAEPINELQSMTEPGTASTHTKPYLGSGKDNDSEKESAIRTGPVTLKDQEVSSL